VSYRHLLDPLGRVVSFAECCLISSMPRGGLQIVQPSEVGDAWLKSYAGGFHAHDALTWRAITSQRPVRAEEAWPEGVELSTYYRGLMQPANLRYAAAAPLTNPVLPGYAGALHIYRKAVQGPFTDRQLQALAEVAEQIDRLAAAARQSRLKPECKDDAMPARPAARQVIFNSRFDAVVDGALDEIDGSVSNQLLDDARRRLQQLNNKLPRSGRLPLPDSNGDLWNFHVSSYRQYPALGEGPFVFYCLEPDYCDWQTLRAADVAADAELARLVPALHFMQEEYHTSPTLNEIARTVHLSPFHFHRRFTQLLGITPKHFMLDCQIFHAKRMLAARERELADIAASCGFAHQSHFTSRFKQAAGLTPTRWRKLAVKNRRAVQMAEG